MPDESEPLDPIAAMDQALRAFADLGRVFFTYYQAMLDAGFTAEQSFALTLTYQTLLSHGDA
jgi:hypothetical protein